MTILRVYDTMEVARFEARHFYKRCIKYNKKVKLKSAPYSSAIRIEENGDCYIYTTEAYASRMKGCYIDKIEEYTRSRIDNVIEELLRPYEIEAFEREYECKWESSWNE